MKFPHTEYRFIILLASVTRNNSTFPRSHECQEQDSFMRQSCRFACTVNQKPGLLFYIINSSFVLKLGYYKATGFNTQFIHSFRNT